MKHGYHIPRQQPHYSQPNSPLIKRIRVKKEDVDDKCDEDENEGEEGDGDDDTDEFDVGIDFSSVYIPDGREPLSSPVTDISTNGCVPQCHQIQTVLAKVESSDEEENVTLNEKQKLAIEAAVNGENVFITGPGGTGKSLVMKEIIKRLAAKYTSPGEWVVLAPTGIAALALNGQTVHSFAGCGVPEVVDDFRKCWDKRDQWRKLKVMLIDEISMLSGEFLDNLSNVVSDIRSKQNKGVKLDEGRDLDNLGGIQLVFCGDFLQLPPIPKRGKDIEFTLIFGKGKITMEDLHCDRGFAFQSKVWKKANLKVIQLDHIFRQDNKTFQNILSEIRVGELSLENEFILEKCARPLPIKNGIRPTVLYPRNKDVTSGNCRELCQLEGVAKEYIAKDEIHVFPSVPLKLVKKAKLTLMNHSFFDDCIAERKLMLKVGAQVMLIKNEVFPTANDTKEKNEKSKHKDYGTKTNDEKVFNEEAIAFDIKRLVNGSRGVVTGFHPSGSPIVHFKCGRTKIVEMEEFSLNLTRVGRCVRNAIPLKLAWAITVHKAQGMSIDYVKADVTHAFTEAQTYVALSRATDEEGLELKGFSRRKIMVDKRALAYYENPKGLFPIWSDPWEYC